MKVNRLNVSYSQTVQWRQFEPITIFASAEVQVDPGDTVSQAFKKTYKQLKTEVEEQVSVIKVQRKENTNVDKPVPVSNEEDYDF